MMENVKNSFELRKAEIQKISHACELTITLHRYNYEPQTVNIKACTFDGEVFNVRVYLSWLLRISSQELQHFVKRYLF